jgi:hypothetical protein
MKLYVAGYTAFFLNPLSTLYQTIFSPNMVNTLLTQILIPILLKYSLVEFPEWVPRRLSSVSIVSVDKWIVQDD